MTNIPITKKAAGAISYGVGLCCGIVIGAFHLKKYYKQMAEDEIEEIRQVYLDRFIKKRKDNPETEKPKESDGQVEVFDMKKYQKEVSDITKEHKYTSAEGEKLEPDTGNEVCYEIPYSIPPELFNTKDGYSVVFLTYYEDGVLVDDSGQIMDVVPIEAYEPLTMPEEILEHIGEYLPDVAYCRDDNLQIDYEITCDPRLYSDIPKPSEVRYEDGNQ